MIMTSFYLNSIQIMSYLNPTELVQVAGFIHQFSIALRDSGAWHVYDGLSDSLGLPPPSTRNAGCLSVQEKLNYPAVMLTDPIADFIRSGGQLRVSAAISVVRK